MLSTPDSSQLFGGSESEDEQASRLWLPLAALSSPAHVLMSLKLCLVNGREECLDFSDSQNNIESISNISLQGTMMDRDREVRKKECLSGFLAHEGYFHLHLLLISISSEHRGASCELSLVHGHREGKRKQIGN